MEEIDAILFIFRREVVGAPHVDEIVTIRSEQYIFHFSQRNKWVFCSRQVDKVIPIHVFPIFQVQQGAHSSNVNHK